MLPGDVIVTGKPGGVGAKRTPPLFVKAGDVVEVSQIGVRRNPIVDRARRTQGKCEGRKAYAERKGGHELVALARQLRGNLDGQPQPLRKIAADLVERGCVTPSGRPYSASAIASMLGEG